MFKKVLLITTALILSSSMLFAQGSSEQSSTAGGPEKVYTMQIAHAQPTTNPRHISLEYFKEIVEERSNGAIKVELYPAGQLGTEKEMLEQVCSGVIQGMRGGQMDFVPKLLVFTLPFLCETSEQVTRLMNSEFAKEICESSKKDGALILGLGDAGGFRQYSNNVRPIHTPADLKGLKMRSNGMDTIDKTFKALGASVVSVPYSDLYMALKTGVSDGQENPWVNIEGMKFYEVQKYFTVLNYQFHPDPFYVNLDWYESLPSEYQVILADATKDMMGVNNQAVVDNQAKARSIVEANCEIYTPTSAELQKFKDATEVVYQQYIDAGILTKAELTKMRATVKGN
jgi:C4-dicarboxylate-binding protein DctP